MPLEGEFGRFADHQGLCLGLRCLGLFTFRLSFFAGLRLELLCTVASVADHLRDSVGLAPDSLSGCLMLIVA